MSGSLGIISGAGNLPRLLAEKSAMQGTNYYVATLENIPLDWSDSHPTIPARIEQIGKLCADLKSAGCEDLVFAGAVSRPNIDPSALDEMGAQVMQAVMGDTKIGDDQTLRYVIDVFEREGFRIYGASDIMPELVPEAGILTAREPSDLEVIDSSRAMEIVRTLGGLDIGQGAVVAGGLCLGLETLQGTNKMLDFVGATRTGTGGVLVKAPKPGQDIRIDMPVIGVDTVRHASDAGLSGIAVRADGVMIIDRPAVVKAAEDAGMTIWAREP